VYLRDLGKLSFLNIEEKMVKKLINYLNKARKIIPLGLLLGGLYSISYSEELKITQKTPNLSYKSNSQIGTNRVVKLFEFANKWYSSESKKEADLMNLLENWEKPVDKGIQISEFHWDAEGNDCSNPNDEYVKFKNIGSSACEFSGWEVRDNGERIYTFPEFVLQPNSEVILRSGEGIDTLTELYWENNGNSASGCPAVWNNTGDTLYLKDSLGDLVLEYTYPLESENR
jgi:hypothetical protein